MPGDYSRFTDDPKKLFTRVLEQQGRVQLDSDWNEMVEILTRSDRLRALDVFGPAAVPSVTAHGVTTSDGFEITPAGPGDFLINAGRIYVDGLLVENFAKTTYGNQPFFLGTPPALPAGSALAYLDAWEREITYVEDPDLLEPALSGVDTTTRTKLVWQVRVEPGLMCDSDLTTGKFAPSDVTMTVDLDPKVEDPDPCRVPESGQFLDVENRHYRVELHRRADGVFFVKFARDPIVAEVTKVEVNGTESTLTVNRIGRDAILRFSQEDDPCVEYLTEEDVLNGRPGVIARIVKIEEAPRQIVIDQPLTPIKEDDDATKMRLRPRLIAWHQKIDAPAEPMIPFNTGMPIPLERGISVTFQGSVWHHGDYWFFPARAAQHTAGPLVDAPPRGIAHHYTPLATLQFPPKQSAVRLTDCRTIWPPQCDCECAECVNPVDHNSGRKTIQMAIDKVADISNGKPGGGKVCLMPGTYALDQPLEIRGSGVTVTGHGVAILIFYGNDPQAILIEGSADITIENIILLRSGSGTIAGITIRSCFVNITIRNCIIIIFPELIFFNEAKLPPFRGIAVGLDGVISDVRITRCWLSATAGVSGVGASATLQLLDAVISDNDVTGYAGIDLNASGLAVSVTGNRIMASAIGIALIGPALSLNVIDGNRIRTDGGGIAIRSDDTTISNNNVIGNFVPVPNAPAATVMGGQSGIIIIPPDANQEDVVRCHIVGNRLRSFVGMGVIVHAPMTGMIKQNFIETTAGGGIIFRDPARGSHVSIDNNDIRGVALGTGEDTACGIRLSPECDAGVIGNVIDGVGSTAPSAAAAAGIYATVPTAVRIHGNRISGIVPTEQVSAGIDVVAPIARVVEIENNIVHVQADLIGANRIHCDALRIRRLAVKAQKIYTFPTQGIEKYVILWQDFAHVSVIPERVAVIVRGNEFETSGRLIEKEAMVRIDDPDVSCTFGGNVCVARPTGGGLRWGALLNVWSAVFDSNQIFGIGVDQLAVEINTFKKGDPALWTMLGNIIVSGQVVINSTSFDNFPDFRRLNRIF